MKIKHTLFSFLFAFFLIGFLLKDKTLLASPVRKGKSSSSSSFSNGSAKKLPTKAMVNKEYSVIHLSPSIYSESLSAVVCGLPLKILQNESVKLPSEFKDNWMSVQVQEHKGYILKKHLESKQLDSTICMNENYPRFMDILDLSLSDQFFWGRLMDFIEETEVGL